MTGDYDSVVGMDRSEPVKRFATGISSGRFVAAGGAATMCGVAVETDDSTGLALRTAAVRMGPHLEVQQPTFWD
jgi:calcineurin-like phosphoesterase